MTQDYQFKEITGESWVRSYELICNNRLGTLRTATFREEQAVNVGDSTMTQALGQVTETFDEGNATEAVDLVHPDTGVVLGQTTYEQVQLVLHSMYLHMAKKRDNRQPIIPDPLPEPIIPE